MRKLVELIPCITVLSPNLNTRDIVIQFSYDLETYPSIWYLIKLFTTRQSWEV